jgi:small subunit ribosomal protein S7
MPRKGPASRRPLAPDPIYQSQLVTQMVNKILLKGKRSTAERIVYSALEQCRRKTGNDPVTTLKRAVENVRPVLETKSRRVGGATYQVPVEVRQGRSTTLALRWLVNFSRSRREKTMADRRQAQGRHPQDGRGQPGLRPLPLVAAPANLPVLTQGTTSTKDVNKRVV